MSYLNKREKECIVNIKETYLPKNVHENLIIKTKLKIFFDMTLYAALIGIVALVFLVLGIWIGVNK